MGSFPVFPELSNSGSPPAQPGVYSGEINNVNKTNYTLEALQKAADKCFAHEWLEHAELGCGKYGGLRITPKGVGAARSKRKSEELKASRGRLKKVSDYIEDHKGLFVVLGFLLALATFALKLLGGDK